MEKINETKHNVMEQIKSLQASSSESIQELHLLLHASNETTFISEIDNIWERQNQDALHCMVKVNQTQNEAQIKTEKINGRIDQLVRILRQMWKKSEFKLLLSLMPLTHKVNAMSVYIVLEIYTSIKGIFFKAHAILFTHSSYFF